MSEGKTRPRSRSVLLAIGCVALLLIAGCSSAGPGANNTTAASESTTEPVGAPTTTDSLSTTAETTVSEAGPTTATARTTTQKDTSTPSSTSGDAPSTSVPTTSTPTTVAPKTTAGPTTTEGPQTEWTVEIVRIVDGDTFEVRFQDGSTEDVRLLGIDTPEVHTANDPAEFEGIPTSDDGRVWLRDWGHKASDYTNKRLAGETVTIETDPSADRRGSYGRLLVYVLDDGENVNKQLIEQGYARMYDSEFSERSAFASAEQAAQNNDVGLWNYEAPDTPEPTERKTESSPNEDVDLPPVPADGDYDCGHFDTHEQAQTVLERDAGDSHRLDADGDGEACESLS